MIVLFIHAIQDNKILHNYDLYKAIIYTHK